MQSVIRKLVLAMAIVAASVPVVTGAAEETEMETVRWYDLEVIIFRHSDPRTDEKWPLDKGLPEVSGLRPLYPAAEMEESDAETTALDSENERRLIDAPEPFTPLPDDELTMSNYRDALERSGRYEPLLHFAWSQPAIERADSPKIRITLPGALDAQDEEQETEETTNRFGDEFSFESTREPLADTDAKAVMEEQDEPDFARPLDGYMQLGVSRYLHVDMDLIYLPDDLNPDVVDGVLPEDDERAGMRDGDIQRQERRRAVMEALGRGDITVEEADILMLEPEEQVFHGFRMNNVRRILAGEVHYFDHPIYGVILKVTPREIEVAQPETD